jgi:hypothetical protein
MSVYAPRCTFCDRPSAFWGQVDGKLIRVVGTFRRLSNKVENRAIYAHEVCIQKNKI